jgi:hypothetical protein
MSANLSIYDDFLAQTGPDRLQKILARYELFKLAMEAPGDICECGVFKGSGLYTWVKLMRLFKPNNEYSVVGFDFFDADRTMDFKYEEDQQVLDEHADRWTPQETLTRTCAEWGFDNLLLYAGNVVETSARYAQEQLGARISLLYIDVDNYEGALGILENLYPLVSRGGVVALDEYALPGYGESDAVDEFFREKNVQIRSIPWANTPSAFVVKP